MAASALRPVSPSERIELLDVLRGFALLGVLYVNMHNFGSDQVTGDAHTAALFFMSTVFEAKFFSLFSLLFGMGFAIQLRRAEGRNVSLIRVYWRRLVILFLIGWLHATIYGGDILRLYAVLAILLFPFKGWSPRGLVLLAIIVFTVDYATWYVFRSDIVDFGYGNPATVVNENIQNGEISEAPVDPNEELAIHRERVFKEGSFLEVIGVNLAWHQRWKRMFIGYGPDALALFLLGFAIIRAGVIDDLENRRPAIRRVMWWMLCIGLPSAAFSAYFEVTDGLENASVFLRTLVSTLYNISYPALALSYASFIALRYSEPAWHKVLHPLAALGRMALTVYVGQSVIYTTIYYGYGLGQFGQLGPAHIIFLAAIIFGLEILVCNWWMNRYRFGPLEWLWRSGTYLSWQRMV